MALSVEVVGLSGFICLVSVDVGATIADLRAAIQEASGIPKTTQRLLHEERELTASETVRSVRQDGDTLRVTLVRRSEQVAGWLAELDDVCTNAGVNHISDWLAGLPSEATENREVILETVSRNGCLLCCFRGMQADREVVLTAVRDSGMALQFASSPLRRDREVVMAAVQQEGGALQMAFRPVHEDRDVVLAAVANSGSALQFAASKFCKDREVVLAAVANDPGVLFECEIPQELRDDREVVLAAVRSDGALLVHAPEALRADREIVRAAVSTCPDALGFASAELRADSEFAEAASVSRSCAAVSNSLERPF